MSTTMRAWVQRRYGSASELSLETVEVPRPRRGEVLLKVRAVSLNAADVLGASGGVGTFAVQLAAVRGHEVWATCGARSRALVEELGATRTFDYREISLDDLPADGFGAVLDIAGEGPLRGIRRLLTPGASAVLIGGGTDGALDPIPRMITATFGAIGSGRRMRSLAATNRPEVLRELVALAVEGRIAPAIERRFPFEEADAALAHVDAGHTVGKVVVAV